MKAIVTIFIFSFMLLCGRSFAQTDPLYNQYLFNQSLFNPAYTGVHDVFNATAITRQQWIGVDGAPVTHTLNASSTFFDNKFGIGLQVVSDQFGVNSNTEIQLMYSYKIEMLNGRSLSFGLQASNASFQFQLDRLTLEQPDQALSVINNDQPSNFNFGTGVFFKGKKYYVGLSVPRLLNPEYPEGDPGAIRYRRHAYLSGGFLLDQLSIIKLKPSALLILVDGKIEVLDLNAQVLLKEIIWLGMSLRNFNTVGFNGMFELSNSLRVGYALELPFREVSTTTALSNISFSTHELMVSLDLGIFTKQVVGRRYF